MIKIILNNTIIRILVNFDSQHYWSISYLDLYKYLSSFHKIIKYNIDKAITQFISLSNQSTLLFFYSFWKSEIFCLFVLDR